LVMRMEESPLLLWLYAEVSPRRAWPAWREPRRGWLAG
jgi:hypothetical protein